MPVRVPQEGWGREHGMTRVSHPAVDDALAEATLEHLASTSGECWELHASDGSMSLPHGGLAPEMRFWAYAGDAEREFLREVKEILERRFGVETPERLVVNCSKYTEGCFLNEHDDATKDGNNTGYIRVRAFIWYLTQDYSEADGGMLEDLLVELREDGPYEGKQYVPEWNTVLHFPVPWPHAVTRVTSARPRYAVYGWILTPEVALEAAPEGSGAKA